MFGESSQNPTRATETTSTDKFRKEVDSVAATVTNQVYGLILTSMDNVVLYQELKWPLDQSMNHQDTDHPKQSKIPTTKTFSGNREGTQLMTASSGRLKN